MEGAIRPIGPYESLPAKEEPSQDLRPFPAPRRWPGRLAWLLALLVFHAWASPRPARAERVARVIDGDTVALEDGRRVRYAGINAPEEGDVYHRESSLANNLLVGNKEVRLEFGRSRNDKHDRLLAYVHLGGVLVQTELVRQGWALVMRTQPIPRYRGLLANAQEDARKSGRGIWAKGGSAGELRIVEVHPRESRQETTAGEYVVFTNEGKELLDLTGWAISDEANRSYLIPNFRLQPGRKFSLYTGKGKNTQDSLYWGQGKTVWNKGGDTVFVKDATGHYVVSHVYSPKKR